MTKRSDFRVDIEEAVKALNLPPSDFRLVSFHEYEPILMSILDRFTTLGKKGLNDHRWSDSFKEPSCSVYLEDTPGVLKELIPPQEDVWFVIEDWKGTKRQGKFWLYEGKISAIIEVIREMHSFEYYIVSKKFEWLLGEDHHGVLIGVGHSITEKIKNHSASK